MRILMPYFFLSCCCVALFSISSIPHLHAEESRYDNYFEDTEEDFSVADPLEPVNRLFFQVNDKLYFWLLKPAARVYGYFIPEDFRMCIRNAFHNLMAPVRILNNLLQGKVRETGTETARFLINSTVGIVGMGDPAKTVFDINPTEEDFGQTLGAYGIGEGPYLCWPILGPSNLRDTVGTVGDSFVNPTSYIGGGDFYPTLAIEGGKKINNTSLVIGEYESLKESSVDPYVSLRNAYHQYRRKEIRK